MIRLGIAMSPLNVSATSPDDSEIHCSSEDSYQSVEDQERLLSLASEEEFSSILLFPYSPPAQRTVEDENAKQHIATAVNIDTQLPYVLVNPWIVISAPAGWPYSN